MQLEYIPANDSDFDELVELRIEAMRESLENIGRFDRERSIRSFRNTFNPATTTKVLVNGTIVAFYALEQNEDHFYLGHLYVSPSMQGRGIGSTILTKVINSCQGSKLPIRIRVLKESRANQFYRRYRFVLISEDEWDNYYELPQFHPKQTSTL